MRIDHVGVKWGVLAILLLAGRLALTACTGENEAACEADSAQSPLFIDSTADLGLTLSNAAAAWADFNNNGWVDLYVSGVIWRNNEGKSFTRQNTNAGGGAVLADFNNNGFVDIFSFSRLKLFINKDGTHFEEIELPGRPDRHISRGAGCGDFTNNGFVDIYVGGYEDWKKGITYPDLLILNKDGKTFSIVQKRLRYRARGVTVCDFNEDGHMDIYVSNYRLQPNVLWVNDGTGSFKNAAVGLNAVATSEGFGGAHTIGAAWGDFDNDGHFDLFVSNFAHRDSRGDQPTSRFLRNTGPEGGYAFEDLGECGVYYQESYASPAAADYDNDGLLDVFVTTVYGTASFGIKNYPVLYRNDGNWQFTDVSDLTGLAKLGPTYQAAWADFNNNGHLDLVTAGRLFVNQGSSNHWLKVRLQGDGRDVNRSAIGAQARIEIKNGTLTRQVEAGTGEGNQNDMTLHFGLGNCDGPVELHIAWPNGVRQTVSVDAVDRLIEIEYMSDTAD